MARRFIGDANIYIRYVCAYPAEYQGSIVVPKDDGPSAVWKFTGLHPPKCGFGPGIAYDSPEAYDEMAQAAASFGSYYTTMNRSNTPDEDLEGYPSGEVADAIDSAVNVVLHDDGTYEVRRKKCVAPSARPKIRRAKCSLGDRAKL